MNKYVVGEYPCQSILEAGLQTAGFRRITGADLTRRKERGTLLFRPDEWMSFTESMDLFDYKVWLPGTKVPVYIDCKDKRQFVPANWGVPEKEKDHWQAFDETAVRKQVNGGLNYFFLFHDYNTRLLFVWTTQDMALGHRRWAVRQVNQTVRKWKLLYHVDSCSYRTPHVAEALAFMADWVRNQARYDAKNINMTRCDRNREDVTVLNQQRGDMFYIQDVTSQGGNLEVT